MRVNRGSWYSTWASSTCSLPSRVAARELKMSKISAVRSPTRTLRAFSSLPESAFSRLRSCPAESSVSKMTVSACKALTARETSATFPLPIYVALLGFSSAWYVVPTTLSPAVSANRPSSSKDSCTVYMALPTALFRPPFPPHTSTPTRYTRSNPSSSSKGCSSGCPKGSSSIWSTCSSSSSSSSSISSINSSSFNSTKLPPSTSAGASDTSTGSVMGPPTSALAAADRHARDLGRIAACMGLPTWR
mmetsp:Transcript_19381/g.33476  ORF Transcript_19381/g.33476 Transcript_19381/m.33476 type:complete len:247 (-) Transcript_19381:67-807(-)